jgi:hypothetical protein
LSGTVNHLRPPADLETTRPDMLPANVVAFDLRGESVRRPRGSHRPFPRKHKRGESDFQDVLPRAALRAAPRQSTRKADEG